MRFRKPDPIPLLFIITAVALFLGLGVWQVQRLYWKEGLLADIARKQAEPALGTLPQNVSGLQYRNVALTGKFLYNKTLCRAGGMRDEPAGFFLLTPFQLDDDGRIVLVNRGFSPPGKDTQPQGTQTVKGVIRPMRRRTMLSFFIQNYPKDNIWSYEDIPAMSKATGLPLLPLVVEEVGKRQPGVYPIPSDGTIFLYNHHLQYAITWFSLALIAAVMFGAYYRTPENKENA